MPTGETEVELLHFVLSLNHLFSLVSFFFEIVV